MKRQHAVLAIQKVEMSKGMKSRRFVLGVFLACGVMSAQETYTPKFEAGLNYSWLHVKSANYDYQRTGNGGSGYIEYNVNHIVGLVGDFGGYANTRKGIDQKLLTYMFGPRFNWRHTRLSPYAQFLFGGGYAWSGPTSTTQNAFATAAGGGLDYNLTKRIAIKPIQVEYVMTQFDSAKLSGATRGFGSHQNDVRYSAGVVFRFGDK
jgi:outer membrane immunogenic protein